MRRPLSAPSIVRSVTRTARTPPFVLLPIDMPCPFQKRLWAIVTWVVGPAPPALIATLSSPVSIRQWAIVTFVEEDGSMPSELRAVFGVWIFTPQAVKPSVLSATTWKFAEWRRVRPARVKPFERRTTRIRGQVCCRSRTFAFLASSHHVSSWPRITAPPRPSIAPRPMTPLPGASSARRSGLQPGPRWPISDRTPQLPGAMS